MLEFFISDHAHQPLALSSTESSTVDFVTFGIKSGAVWFLYGLSYLIFRNITL